MFFKKFMEKVAAVEAAGEFKDLFADEEVAKGEEVVGSFADNPYLMALFIAGKNWIDACRDKVLQMVHEDEIMRMAERVEREDEEFRVIREIMWTELRLHFGVIKDEIRLRKGWTVVRTKGKQPTVKMLDVIEVFIKSDCGNPDCPVHGIKA